MNVCTRSRLFPHVLQARVSLVYKQAAFRWMRSRGPGQKSWMGKRHLYSFTGRLRDQCTGIATTRALLRWFAWELHYLSSNRVIEGLRVHSVHEFQVTSSKPDFKVGHENTAATRVLVPTWLQEVKVRTYRCLYYSVIVLWTLRDLTELIFTLRVCSTWMRDTWTFDTYILRESLPRANPRRHYDEWN